MNKAELVHEVAKKAEISLKDATNAYEVLLWKFSACIKAGEPVKLQGLGTLKPITRAARKRHNVATGEMVDAPEKRTVKFIPSRVFLEALN